MSDLKLVPNSPIPPGKVVAIVTSTALVINLGSYHGVTKGMRFGVFFNVGPITDPDDATNVVDTLRFRKGTVTVSLLYEKMAYCTIDPSATPVAPVDPPQQMVRYPEVERPIYTKEDRAIRVGDTVEQVEEVPKAKADG